MSREMVRTQFWIKETCIVFDHPIDLTAEEMALTITMLKLLKPTMTSTPSHQFATVV